MTDLERVARAISASKGINPDMCVSGSGGTGEIPTVCYQRAWELETGQARAALEALLEVHERAHAAGIAGLEFSRGARRPVHEQCANYRRAMIRHILNQSSSDESAPESDHAEET